MYFIPEVRDFVTNRLITFACCSSDIHIRYSLKQINYRPANRQFACWYDDCVRPHILVYLSSDISSDVPDVWAKGHVPCYVLADWLEENVSEIPAEILSLLREPQEQ